MNDKVSVIVPFYNSSKTIDKCIQSLLNQTYTNFEAILVNDGGSDDSENKVRKYMEKDSRIKLISNNHGGVSSARNAGIRNATGNYIEFLDSDDHLEPNMIERLVETSKKHDADIVVCNYTHPTFKNYFGNSVINATDINDLRKYYQTTFAVVVPWNKLYKREVIKTFFDEEVSFCEDELFGLANMFNAKKIVGTDEVLYHYYIEPKETSIEESSAINKIGKQEKFWLTKDTYWYKRRDLLNKSKNILKNNIDDSMIDDFAYVRIFDFMIWELLILNQIGADHEGIIYEVNEIFNEEDFIKGITTKEKYGLKYNRYYNKELSSLVRKYVDTCVYIANDVDTNGLKVKPFYACVNLFVKMFMSRNNNSLDTSDLLASAYDSLEKNSTIEAEYINNLKI